MEDGGESYLLVKGQIIVSLRDVREENLYFCRSDRKVC